MMMIMIMIMIMITIIIIIIIIITYLYDAFKKLNAPYINKTSKNCERFEPRSHFRSSMIVRRNVVTIKLTTVLFRTTFTRTIILNLRRK